MVKQFGLRLVFAVLAIGLTGWGAWNAFQSTTGSASAGSKTNPDANADVLQRRFSTQVQPFLERYCYSCHGFKKPKAGLDLSRDSTMTAITKNERQWERVLQRLHDQEMPPENAPRRPKTDERAAVIAWIRALHDDEARRHAGDPGIVLARRL